MMVKGAKYFEAFAKADTIVFDKTGTLTEATPELATVLTTDGWSEDEVLRLRRALKNTSRTLSLARSYEVPKSVI